MSDSPFEPPKETSSRSKDSGTSAADEHWGEVVHELQRARGWQRFFAVLGFIMSGLIGLVLVIMVITSLFTMNIVGLFCGGLVYGLILFVYFRPSLYLWDSATALSQAALGDDDVPMLIHRAASSQAKFWQFIGIATIVGIIAYIFLVGGLFLFGITAMNTLDNF